MRTVGFFALLILVCPPASAGAQTLNYQRFLIGDRALGLGGAFTGVADDASAAYYNPAGLARLETSTLSGSLQVNAFDRYEVEGGYGSAVGVADLEHEAAPTVPVFVGLVKKFGRRDSDGFRRHAIALSTVRTVQERRRFGVSLFNASTDVETTWEMDQADEVTWWGPSYAYQALPELSLGVSAFLATRSFEQSEDEVVVTRGMLSPAGSYENSTLSLRQTRAVSESKSILLRLGALWQATPRVRVGVMFQPPSVQVHSSARLSELETFADLRPPIIGTFLRTEQPVATATATPWELRVGGSYSDGDVFTFALDVSLYGPVASAGDPLVAFGGAAPDPVTGRVPTPGNFVVQNYRAEFTANLSVGAEVVIAEVVPLRVGFFTDLSAAPDVRSGADVYAPAQVNGLGATFSVGLRSGGYDLAIGAAGLWGVGTAHRMNPDPTSPVTPGTFLTGEVRTQTIYFFFSGAKSAASRLARNVYHEYVRPDRETAPDAGGDDDANGGPDGQEPGTRAPEPSSPASPGPQDRQP